jgi:hypothetical protein
MMTPIARYTPPVTATLAILALFAGASPLSAQEACSANSEWQIPGRVVDRMTTLTGAQDWKISKPQIAAMIEHSRRLMDVILKIEEIAKPVGLQVGWARAVGDAEPGHFTLADQPYPLGVEAMIFGFTCSEGVVSRRWTHADAGVSISMNSAAEILNNTDATVRGQPVYALNLDLGAFRGHRLFMPATASPKDRAYYTRFVLVTRPGRSPFTYVTKGEFFDYLAAELNRNEAPETARAATTVTVRPKAEQEAAVQRRIKEIEGYNISESAKQARIKRVLADAKSDEQLKEEAVARSTASFAKMRARLLAMRSGLSAAQLLEPASIQAGTSTFYALLANEDWSFVNPVIDTSCYPGCTFGQYLVTLNRDYFDWSLPRTAPQLYVVRLGTLGLPEQNAPSWRRIRDEALAKLDFGTLASLLPR